MESIVKAGIVVESKGDILVVDSRLVAEGLGIEHRAFMQTLKKYESRIEQSFGVITFEMSKPLQGSQGGRPEKFAWLTEDQSLFLMTLSRNTDQVIECKANLVEAFSKARQVIPAQAERIKELELQNAILDKQLALRQLDNTMIALHGERVVLALRGCADVIVEKETVVTEVIDLEQGTSAKFLTADQLKRAVSERVGQKLPSLKYFVEQLRKAGRDDLLVPVRRANLCEYPVADKIDEAIKVVYGRRKQRLLGQ